MNAPFKFLDSYEKDELDVFFGRDKDTERLYDALSGVKHLLVYGPSGAGKTSLIECGLRNQFSDADWLAITVRRGHNLISSVFEALNSALRRKFPINPDTRLPKDPEFDFGDAVESLYAEQYKPVYLLFDQFEELLIQADDDEKTQFFTRLNRLIRYKTPCRMLLILREEFIGHFSDYESLCPSIFQHRFRLEKMSRGNVREVISNLLTAPRYSQAFQVKDAEALTNEILKRLPDKQKEIELAHVQVFLSELWDRAAEHAKNTPVLSPDLVQEKDNLETVLVSFLEKQRKALDAVYGENVSLELLVAMITERNTKLQVSAVELQQELEHRQIVLKRPLPDLLHDLEQSRIVRTLKSGEQTQYEISHDVLAKVVGENLSEDMKQRRRALEIADVYQSKGGYLSQEDLDLLRPFQSHLPANMRERMLASEVELTRRAKVEVNRNQRRVALLSGLLVVAVIGLGFAWWQYSEAKKQTRIAEAQTKEANRQKLKADKQTQIAETRSAEAKSQADSAKQQRKIAIAQTKEANRQKLEAQKQKQNAEAQKLEAQNALAKANAEAEARTVAEQAKQKIEITRLLSEAETYLRAKLYKNARAKLEAVLIIDPNHVEAKEKLKLLQ
ncbi:AAA family ATPase [Haliscomenobacter hydrossis]|uniref:Novel STAND NTPase 1 domain-containing protein n=1 Tax=Haliscomenobacter hydrossis (strain ATCC 27775 / DSM 1100 / LMG 10767 / O) TaxID=760192 RepID=F4KU46_HALH1|nr:AAA family ATPase [Haliscomenobacter hydrossis]AEE50143.1 hypothetical protein Halhy_2264 [Haliscomenobacter hydrossis DSM 1100]